MTIPPIPEDFATIVMLGAFNPAIFTPDWLKSRELFGHEELEAIKIEIVSPEVTSLKLPWGQLLVDPRRFEVRVMTREFFESARDLVYGIFKILEHTPIEQMGLNRVFRRTVTPDERWHAIGHSLVPKTFWGKLLVDPGMLALKVRGKPLDDVDARIDVSVDPFPGTPNGVTVSVNEHHPRSGVSSSEKLLLVLLDRWDSHLRNSEDLAEAVFGLETTSETR